MRHNLIEKKSSSELKHIACVVTPAIIELFLKVYCHTEMGYSSPVYHVIPAAYNVIDNIRSYPLIYWVDNSGKMPARLAIP